MFLTRIKSDAGSDRSVFGNFFFQPVGGLSGGGVRVTAGSAMSLPAVFACVRVLAESFASMPFKLYEPTEGGLRGPQIKKHWLYRLFAKAPNQFQTPYEWRLMLMGHLALRGNAFCQITANSAGDVVDLLPLHPDRITVEMLSNGSYRYIYSDQVGKQIIYGRNEIWHLRGLSSDGIVGMSPIDMEREAIGEGLAMQSYSSRFFANDSKPGGGWIEYPGSFADKATKQTFRESWQEMQGGANRGKVAVLEKGMKFHELGLSNKDSQFIEARAAKVSEIARIFRVPPHKIGDLARCMPASTLVYTMAGPKRIVDVHPGDSVWSFDGQKLVAARVLNNWENGHDEIIELRTTNRTVRCNAQHRLLVRRRVERDCVKGELGGKNVKGKKVRVDWESAYVPAGELTVGDTLVSLDSLPDMGGTIAPNGRQLTVGFMEFAGLLAGDGNVFDWGVSIARCPKASYMNHYRKVMRKEFTCGGREYAAGENHEMAKITAEQADEIRALAPRIESASAIAREFSANITTVCAIDRGHEYDAESACAGISAENLIAIKSRLAVKTTAKQVASQYGLTADAVRNIINGRSWSTSGTIDPIRPVELYEGRMSTCFSSVMAGEELRILGLSGTAFTKSIPAWVFGLSEELRQGYLRGIVDSDGTIDKKGRITVSLVNKHLIDQIRHLFMSCGVPVTNTRSAEVTTIPPGSNKPHTTTMHAFTCSDPGANRRVGSHDVRYIQRLKDGKPFGKKDRNYPKFGGKGFDADGLSLSRIVGIEILPAEPVYDIEVEAHHCFIADGIVSHNSTFSNIEQQAIEFWTDTMWPWAELWESSIEFFLLGPDSDFEPEFDMSRMMRGDGAARATRINTLIMCGAMSRNEGRTEEGLDPMEGLDRMLVPMNMAVLDEDGNIEPSAGQKIAPGPVEPDDLLGADPDEPTAPPDKAAPPDARFKALLTGNAQRMGRRIVGGSLPSAEVLADALAVTVQTAGEWLLIPPVGLNETQIAASLMKLAFGDSE